VQGYRDEPGVDPDSRTETFVALRTEIANWRWAGVPFYIRTGKRLASRDARIEVNFRPTPHAIYRAPAGSVNKLVINLQPKDGLELHMLAQAQDNRQRATATRAPPRSWRRCSSTWTSTSASASSAWAPTSACCST
jgi:glucose-6-phosphate 1-dehydrogenase